jgi:hypothetical protein
MSDDPKIPGSPDPNPPQPATLESLAAQVESQRLDLVRHGNWLAFLNQRLGIPPETILAPVVPEPPDADPFDSRN